jgi:hypothetical protein
VTSTTTLDIGVVFDNQFGFGRTANSGVRLSNIAVSVNYDLPLPDAPTDLTVSNVIDPYVVSLIWTDHAANESGFRVERSIDGIAFAQVGMTLQDVTHYSDFGGGLGLPNGVYYYRVYAYNASGNSGYSNVVRIVVPQIVQ